MSSDCLRPLTVALICSLTTGALAQQDDDGNAKTLSPITVSAPPATALDAPAGTATRLGTTIRDTPASVEVVTREAMQERGKRTTTEALEAATGMTVIVNGSTPGVAATRGFTGNGVRLLFDGLAVGAPNVVGRPGDSFNLDRLEILKGPASVLYGEGAIGGAVNYVTKAPARKAEPIDLLLGIGDMASRRIGLGTGGVLSPGAAYFRVDASASERKTDIKGYEQAFNRVNGTLLFDLTPTLSLALYADYVRDAAENFYWGTPLNNGRIDERLRKINYNNLTDNRYSSTASFLRANLEWRPNPAWEVHNVLYHYDAYRDFRDAEGYAFNPATNTVTRSSFGDLDHTHKVLGDRLEMLHKGEMFGLANRVALGAEWSQTDFFSARNGFPGSQTVDAFNPPAVAFNSVTPINRTPARDVRVDQWAAFIEDQLSLTPQLKLVGGLRHDKIDAHFIFLDAGGATRDPSFSPTAARAGVVFDLTPNITLYGQYSNATEPVSTLLLSSAANTAFGLTKGRQYEFGAKGSFWNGRGEATLAVYDIEKKNVLTRDPNNAAQVISVGRQSSRGVELAAAIRPVHQLRIDGNLAVLDARFDEFSERVSGVAVSRAGNVPFDVPELVANLGLRFMPNADLYFAAYGRHVGKRYLDNANSIVMPAYTLLDLSAGYRITRNVELALWVRNATDKLYAASSDGSNGFNQQVLLGDPRSFEAVLTAKF